jgi:hypothetical protein
MAAADRCSGPLPASANDFGTRQMARGELSTGQKIFRRFLILENLDEYTFYVTTMGENQAPAIFFSRNVVRNFFLGS